MRQGTNRLEKDDFVSKYWFYWDDNKLLEVLFEGKAVTYMGDKDLEN